MDFKSLYLLRQNKVVCTARKGQMLLNSHSKELVWSFYPIALIMSNNNNNNSFKSYLKIQKREKRDI